MVVTPKYQVVASCLVASEVYLIAAVDVVVVAHSEQRHHASRVPRVGYETDDEGAVTAVAGIEGEGEVGVVGFFNIGENGCCAVFVIAAERECVGASVDGSVASGVDEGIAPAVVSAVVVSLLESIAPVGVQCISTRGEGSGNGKALAVVKFVAVCFACREAGDDVGTGGVGDKGGVVPVDNTDGDTPNLPYGLPLERCAVAADAV